MGYCMVIFMLMEPLPERREGWRPQKTMTTQWREAILGITMDGGQNRRCLMWTLELKFDQSMIGLRLVKIFAKRSFMQKNLKPFLEYPLSYASLFLEHVDPNCEIVLFTNKIACNDEHPTCDYAMPWLLFTLKILVTIITYESLVNYDNCLEMPF